jgi:hypothetical protein
VFCRHSSSSSHRFRVISAFSSRENGPEAEIGGRWRHLAEVTWPFDRPTPVCYSCSVDIPRPALIVFELLAHFHLKKTDRKRKSAGVCATQRKFTWPFDRPIQDGYFVLYAVPVYLLIWAHQRDVCVKPRRLSHHACFGATSRCDCEKNYKQKFKISKSQKSLYFTYAWGRPYPTDCNGSLHIC